MQHAIFLCVNVQCVLGRGARPWSNDGFSHARTTFVRSFIRIDRSFVCSAQSSDSSQPFPRFRPPIVRQFFRLLVLGNLRREPRVSHEQDSELTVLAAILLPTRTLDCWFVAKGFRSRNTAQLRLLGVVQLPLLVTARRDWVPTCTFCARDHRLTTVGTGS